MAYRGKFNPKNPEKYDGDHKNIVYRSLLELKMMMYFDTHPEVLKWQSEEFYIKYLSPIDNKYHRYFPDFFIEKINEDGKTTTKILIEVKPLIQTAPPKKMSMLDESKTKKAKRRYIKEVKTWGVNEAKWNAAIEVCNREGWKWQIITDKDINGKT